MKPSEEKSLTALLTASRNGDAGSVANIWRDLTPLEQEEVLFTLLGLQSAASAEGEAATSGESPDHQALREGETETLEAVTSGESPDDPDRRADETAALAVVEQTEPIPKLVEDLRGLTGSEGDEHAGGIEPPVTPSQYWSRWVRRWKISALVAAWAVTTVFAFTADTSTFGPMEWLVSMLGTVVLGGALVGTLVNFAVAAISTPARPRSNN